MLPLTGPPVGPAGWRAPGGGVPPPGAKPLEPPDGGLSVFAARSLSALRG